MGDSMVLQRRGFLAPKDIPPSEGPDGATEMHPTVAPPPGGRFQKGHRLSTAAHRATLDANPVESLRRRVREIYNKVRSGKLESHVGSVLITCLKFELELHERFDVGARLAKCDVEVAQLEARYAELRGRTSPARVR
jgi:hypothetical protein